MVKDMFGREVKVGSLIIMKNQEVVPSRVIAIEGPIIKPTPMGLVSIHTLKIVAEVTVQVAGENGVSFPAMLVKEPEEDKKGPSLVL